MNFDREQVRKNAQEATTEDLMDRVTLYGAEMEPEAVRIIEAELTRRCVDQLQLEAHRAQRKRHALIGPDGTALRCSFCERPASTQRWGWHRLWGLLPIFPRRFAYCAVHQPRR